MRKYHNIKYRKWLILNNNVGKNNPEWMKGVPW